MTQNVRHCITKQTFCSESNPVAEGCLAFSESKQTSETWEEDDLQEPVADAARAILDGHIVLNRGLAEAGVYPAIDVSSSISRVMSRVVDAEQETSARLFKQLWSRYREQEDLINVGAYQAGSDPLTDQAIAMQPQLRAFVSQGMGEVVSREQSAAALRALMAAPDRTSNRHVKSPETVHGQT